MKTMNLENTKNYFSILKNTSSNIENNLNKNFLKIKKI